MGTTRLAVLLTVGALGAAGLVPASAAPAAPVVSRQVDLGAGRSLHAAVLDLVSGLDAARLAAWRSAMVRSADPVEEESSESSATSSPGPARDFADVYAVGDVDGDARQDVAVVRNGGTVVRSGRDGRVLLRRESGLLQGISGAGSVKLLAFDVAYAEEGRAFELTMQLRGLDRRGRALWEHDVTGTVTGTGAGPAYVVRLETVPALLAPDQRDARGRPALLLGALTGADSSVGAATRLDLRMLSLHDGSTTDLPSTHGAGAGLPYAFPVEPSQGAAGCYATAAPVGSLSQVALHCDGEQQWSKVVGLRDPFIVDAGDFDGDRTSDLQLTTFGFERPKPREVLRGTRVLSRVDGSALGASAVDGLAPLRADVDGDGQPDFMEFAFEDEGFAVQGLTLAGKVLYRSTLGLRTSGSLEGRMGVDVTGDGVSDAFLRAQPEKGDSLSVVVDGRTGRSLRVKQADGLLSPGLRRTGIDLLTAGADAGRQRLTVLSGDRARQLLDVRVPGPAGTPSFGGAGTAHLDKDGRRDLVVASRSGDRSLTTAYSATGRLLWQSTESAAPAPVKDGFVVVSG